MFRGVELRHFFIFNICIVIGQTLKMCTCMCLVCVICNSNSFYSFIFKTFHNEFSHIEDMHLLFCAHLIIFYYILGLLNLNIIMSAPPLVCLHCVICNSNNYHFYLFKPCIPNSDILNMCNSFYCAALIYIFRTFFWMLNLNIFTPTTHRFTSATLMRCLLCIICNTKQILFHLY